MSDLISSLVIAAVEAFCLLLIIAGVAVFAIACNP